MPVCSEPEDIFAYWLEMPLPQKSEATGSVSSQMRVDAYPRGRLSFQALRWRWGGACDAQPPLRWPTQFYYVLLFCLNVASEKLKVWQE